MEKTSIKYTIYEKLKAITQYALKEQKSFACWTLPHEDRINVLVADEVMSIEKNTTLEELQSGFVFTPFNHETEKSYFLKASFHWSSDDEEAEIPEVNAKKEIPYYNNKNISLHNTPNDHYLTMVERAIEHIAEGDFEKVVPGRNKSTRVNEDFDVIEFFLNLTRQYSDAFVSFVSIENAGTWLGASPETLIEVKDNIFKTVALAGTQPYDPTRSVRETSWTQKEIEEQALVSRYIINCFKKIRLREFDEFGPKTVRAGNLLHLKTEFQVDMKETNYPDLGSIMLQLLHPTSAVCGMPIENAQRFLNEHEDFDRKYFSGYLGPVNMDNATYLFVNLRCMQLVNDHIITYAGAGVTIDSEPAKELNETEIKMNTLIRMMK